MTQKSTFRLGGVHPKDMKYLTHDKAIEPLRYEGQLVVSASEHLGAPAKFIVNKGDRVERGEKVGESASFISAAVHSPVSGTIVDIRPERLATGAEAPALIIDVDKEATEKITFNTPYEWENLSKEELLSLVSEMGIVGMGGATFPTTVKFSVGDKKVDYLVINAVECEPYVTADYRLMMERPEALLEGAMIAGKIVNPKHIVFGIEANKKDAYELLKRKAEEKGYPIEFQLLKMKYPQGDEKQLLYAITKREMPSGKLPLDIGAIVCNTATTNAIYEAIKFHKPLMERVVTVTGCVKEPKNLLSPIGTPFSYLVDYCGGVTEENIEIVSGGPMMGFDVPSLSVPTVKGTNGILILKEEISKTFPCISCGKCVAHCPMGLMPNRMYRNIIHDNVDTALSLGLMDCKECGCCAYSCPSHIPLVQGFKLGKKKARKK